MGSAVKALIAASEDKLGCSIRIGLDVIVPEPNDDPTLFLEERGPSRVISHSVRMLAAIKLNSQLRFTACQIHNERSNHQLTRETRTIVPQSQP